MEEIVVNARGDHAAVRAGTGDRVVLRLPENPTTGFCWEAEPSAAVAALESRYRPVAGSATGGGGEREFVLRVAGPGAVVFRSRRSWEGPERAAAIFRLEISPV